MAARRSFRLGYWLFFYVAKMYLRSCLEQILLTDSHNFCRYRVFPCCFSHANSRLCCRGLHLTAATFSGGGRRRRLPKASLLRTETANTLHRSIENRLFCFVCCRQQSNCLSEEATLKRPSTCTRQQAAGRGHIRSV